MDDKRYNISLEVITPLCVGAGNDNDWYCGADYIISNGKVYVIDIAKASLKGIDLNQLSNLFVRQDINGITKIIGNNLEEISKFIFDAPASTNNPIKTFLRTQLYGVPLVAGSSIKGAIRSTLFKYLRNNENNNEDVFGKMKDGTDFMRFIRVGDIEMNGTELLNSKIFNLTRNDVGEWTGGWKHARDSTNSTFKRTGFNTLYECVIPGKIGLGTITFANNAYNLLVSFLPLTVNHKEKKNRIMSEGIDFLFKIINNCTRDYLEKEKNFFQTYHAERSDEILSNIIQLLDMIPDDDSYCLLKMSAGVGFHNITGNWQYDSYENTGTWPNGKKKYKSRKSVEFLNKLHLMGFVKISKLNDNELSERNAVIEEEHRTIIDKQIELIHYKEKLKDETKNKIEQEKERIKKEKELAELRKKEEEEKKAQEDINRKKETEIVSEAYQYKQVNEYKMALEKFKEAERFGFNDYIREINECELAIKEKEIISGDIEAFLSQITKLASIPAFANRLKKRYPDKKVADEDLTRIAEFIKEKLDGDQKLAKQWNKGSWVAIEEAITKDSSDKLKNLIFG